MTIHVKNEHFLINRDTAWFGQYLSDLYLTACTPWKWHAELYKTAIEEDVITNENIRSIRLRYSLHTKYYNKILGKKFINNVNKGEPLSLDMIESL